MLVLWCALYVGAVVALWVTAWQDYAASGVCTQVARAAGANLNMHGALMLITMLPKTHTALGAVPWLAVWLPLDLMNTGHKIFSCMTGVFAVIHTTAHAANWMTQAGGGHDLAMTKIFTVTRTLGLVPGWAGPTGVALWLCYVVLFAGWSSRISWMMFEGARGATVAVRLQARPTPFSRPPPVFIVSHSFLFAWYAFSIVHAPNTYKWIAGPLFLYLCERALRIVQARMPAQLTAYALLPARVTELHISRPAGLHSFQPGSYVFVKIPCVRWGAAEAVAP